MLPSPSRLRTAEESWFAPEPKGLRLVPRENRIAVLMNANAKRVTRRVRERFAALVPEGDLFYSESLEDGRRHARAILEHRYGTVLIGGGDGTIAATMNLLLEAAREVGRATVRPPSLPDLGILRLGTGNGLAHLVGAGAPEEDAARLLAGERPEARPLRLVEDAESGWVFPFASMGYDAALLNDFEAVQHSSRSALARSLSKTLAGYFYALGTRTIPNELRSKHAHVRVTSVGRSSILDPETGEEIPLQLGATLFEGTARAVLVGTSPYYGFGLKALPHAMRRSDRFHVRVSAASIPYLLTHLPGLWKGSLKTSDIVDFLVEGVRIESSVPLPVQMAGDARGYKDKLELRLSDRAFRLLQGKGAEQTEREPIAARAKA